MYRFRIVIFSIVSLLLLNSNLSFPQEPAEADNNDIIVETGSENKVLNANNDKFKVELRLPLNDMLDEYKNDPDFKYENRVADNDDWISRITSWLNQQIRNLRNSKTYSTALDVFYYGMALFALLIIIWGLLKSEKGFLIFTKSAKNDVIITEDKEDVNLLEFDQLISSAIDNKNYKLAVRYLFLKLLKMLSDKEIIEYRKDKTNHQYLDEIEDIRVSNAFLNTASRFEWIWYGDFPLDDTQMEKSKIEFNKIYELIKSR